MMKGEAKKEGELKPIVFQRSDILKEEDTPMNIW